MIRQQVTDTDTTTLHTQCWSNFSCTMVGSNTARKIDLIYDTKAQQSITLQISPLVPNTYQYLQLAPHHWEAGDVHVPTGPWFWLAAHLWCLVQVSCYRWAAWPEPGGQCYTYRYVTHLTDCEMSLITSAQLNKQVSYSSQVKYKQPRLATSVHTRIVNEHPVSVLVRGSRVFLRWHVTAKQVLWPTTQHPLTANIQPTYTNSKYIKYCYAKLYIM